MSSNLKAWSSFPTKAAPISTDLLAILDSEDGNSTTKNKTILISSLPGGISGVTSINADTTAAQIIAAGSGLGIVDAGAIHTLSIDSTVATLTGTQILTNKTLTTPTIVATGFTNMQHTHQATNTGGTLLAAAISDFATATAATASVTANTAKVTNQTHTGDATGSTALTIANNAVTLSKFQDIATSSFLGRVTAATGDPEVLTGTQATTLLNVFTSSLKGVVPSSGGGTTNFLRADGTFAAPAGGGDMVLADVQTVTGAKTFGTSGGAVGKFALAGSTSGSTILNAAATASGTVVLPITGTLATLAGTETLTNKTLTTPTIASFTNATHNHQDAPGGGTLLSTSALSDTANIAYLNTANVFGSALTQTFTHAAAATGLRLLPVAGDVTTTPLNGSIWYNLTTNKFRGRENGVTVDLIGAGGAQTPWTSDIDADGFDLKDLSNIEFRTSTGAPAGTVQAIWADAGGINLNVPTGDLFDLQINAVSEYAFSATAADFNGNHILLDAAADISFDGATQTQTIVGSAVGIRMDVPTGDSFKIYVNNVEQVTFLATQMAFNPANYVISGVGKLQFDSSDNRIEIGASDRMDLIAGSQFGLRLEENFGKVNVVIGENSAALTTAVDGFLYLPTMPGVPTGDSTDYTGKLPIVYDSTNSKLMINTTAATWVEIGGGGGGDMVLADTQTSTGKKTFQADATNAGINVGILTADPSTLVNGDRYYNSTSNKNRMVENSAWIDVVTDTRNITLAADATEESILGSTLTKVKDMSFIKGVISYQTLTIEIDLKTDNITNPAICRVRHDSLGTDDLVLQTSSLTYVVLSGTIDVSAFSTGRHTIEFYLEDGAGETATLRETWVFGKE